MNQKKLITQFSSFFTNSFKKLAKIPVIQNILKHHTLVQNSKRKKAVFYSICALLFAIIIGSVFLLKDLPSPRRLTHSDNYSVSTQIFDRNGQLLYEILPMKIEFRLNLIPYPNMLAKLLLLLKTKIFIDILVLIFLELYVQ